MSTTRAELTWAERTYRFVAEAIPPLLASGHLSVLKGYLLFGVFLFMLGLAGLSAYLASTRSRKR